MADSPDNALGAEECQKEKHYENAFRAIQNAFGGPTGPGWHFPCQHETEISRAFAAMLLDGRLCMAARILAGLSQTELAAQASVAVSVVARFEQGLTQPRLSTIRALVGALGAHGIEVIAESERYEGGLALVRGKWRGRTK